jgi:hypothetical protein
MRAHRAGGLYRLRRPAFARSPPLPPYPDCTAEPVPGIEAVGAVAGARVATSEGNSAGSGRSFRQRGENKGKTFSRCNLHTRAADEEKPTKRLLQKRKERQLLKPNISELFQAEERDGWKRS